MKRVFTQPSLAVRASLVLALALILAACGPAPLGVGWPAVGVVQLSCGETSRTGIMLAYTDRLAIVNPVDGRPLSLLNADCEPRPPDEQGNERVWDYRPGGGRQFYTLPMLLDDQTLFAIAYDQHMYKVDLSIARSDTTAGVPIQGRTGHTVADPVLSEDLIYVGLSAKDLVALERSTLDVVWSVTTEHGVWARPLLHEGVLYIPSLDHHLYAVDAETGLAIWPPLDLGGAVAGTPVYHDGSLYVGSFGRKIFRISLDGVIEDEFTTDGWIWGAPVIVDDVLYLGDLNGYVYALDTRDGLTSVWPDKVKVANGAIRATPVVIGDRVIVASRDQKLYWLNREDGSQAQDTEGGVLVRELQGQILSDVLLIEPSDTVAIDEPYVVVSSTAPNQLLAAYTLDNAQAMWTYPPSN